MQVDDQVKDIVNDMKVVKSDADVNERIRLVILEIKDGYIKVENIYREKDLSGEEDIFKFFVNLLDKEKCRYLLYDCHFETKESSKKEELVFVMWYLIFFFFFKHYVFLGTLRLLEDGVETLY